MLVKFLSTCKILLLPSSSPGSLAQGCALALAWCAPAPPDSSGLPWAEAGSLKDPCTPLKAPAARAQPPVCERHGWRAPRLPALACRVTGTRCSGLPLHATGSCISPVAQVASAGPGWEVLGSSPSLLLGHQPTQVCQRSAGNGCPTHAGNQLLWRGCLGVGGRYGALISGRAGCVAWEGARQSAFPGSTDNLTVQGSSRCPFLTSSSQARARPPSLLNRTVRTVGRRVKWGCCLCC